jgi:hypothetical protein
MVPIWLGAAVIARMTHSVGMILDGRDMRFSQRRVL